MFGKIIGAIAGSKAAKHSRHIGGTRGALMGVASASLLRKLSIPAVLAIGAGGYALKKYKDRKDAERAKRKNFETPPKPSAT